MRREKKEEGRVNIFSAITIFQAYSNYFLHIGSLNLVNSFISFSVTHSSFSSVISSVTHFQSLILQSLIRHFQSFVLSWTAAHEALLSFTSSLSLLKLISMI